MNTSAQRKNGAALIVVALAMVAASLIGVAILAKATGARYERVQFGIANRAYYLAESGPAYVRARSDADPEFGYPPMHTNHPPYTNVLANGDQFIVTAYRTNIPVVTTNAGVTNFASALHTIGQSIGIARPGSGLEARRRIFFDMVVKGHTISNFPGDAGSPMTGDPGNPDYNDDMYNETGFSKVEIKDSGPSQEIAVVPKVEKGPSEGRLALNWTADATLSNALTYVYQARDRLLSYDVQTKLAYFPNVPATHWMMGLSFRLHENAQEYGLSFFHSETNAAAVAKLDENAPWVLNLDAPFSALRGSNFYVVLWYRAAPGATLHLINSHRLPASYLYLDNGDYELGYYHTLLLQLDEVYVDAAHSNRENRIVAYLATTNLNPIWPNYHTTNAVWQENAANFPAPIAWDQNPYSPATSNGAAIVDVRITSADFLADQNAEIGIHLFYDRNSNNENFLRDFAIRFDSYGSPYGGSQIQW